MLDDADPNPCSARMLRLEAAHWRRMAECLDGHGDTVERDDLLRMACVNDHIASRMEALA